MPKRSFGYCLTSALLSTGSRSVSKIELARALIVSFGKRTLINRTCLVAWQFTEVEDKNEVNSSHR